MNINRQFLFLKVQIQKFSTICVCRVKESSCFLDNNEQINTVIVNDEMVTDWAHLTILKVCKWWYRGKLLYKDLFYFLHVQEQLGGYRLVILPMAIITTHPLKQRGWSWGCLNCFGHTSNQQWKLKQADKSHAIESNGTGILYMIGVQHPCQDNVPNLFYSWQSSILAFYQIPFLRRFLTYLWSKLV